MCALSHLLEPLCLLFWANSLLGKLQPWSQGVIAAVVFLVLVAIVFVVNKFWCTAPAYLPGSLLTAGDYFATDYTEGNWKNQSHPVGLVAGVPRQCLHPERQM
uniref:Uncharacterized protein n=1 Tax=Anas zonorhyncha TaxID=75864 RepID=A0A8B9ZVD7_9AVES